MKTGVGGGRVFGGVVGWFILAWFYWPFFSGMCGIMCVEVREGLECCSDHIEGTCFTGVHGVPATSWWLATDEGLPARSA